MANKKLSLKDAVNQALRAGLQVDAAAAVRFRAEPHAFGFKPGIDRDKLNQLADEFEAEDFLEKLADDRS